MGKLKDAMNTQCATGPSVKNSHMKKVSTLITNISRGLDALPTTAAARREDEESKKTS